MADAKTKIVIDVGEGAKSLRQLKAEFKEGQKELEGLTVGTKQYVEQLKKIAAVKDEINDLNTAITAFRPDQKLAAFTGAARGLAAGFEAATAAQALFGSKSEDVEKALLKVQSAMALANAIQEVGELGKSFKLLGTIIKSAFASNPLGIILAAIAATIAVIGAFMDSEDDATEANDRFTKSIDRQSAALERQNKKIDLSTERAKLWAQIRGQNEESIRKIEEEGYQKRLAAAKKYEEEVTKNYQRIAARQKGNSEEEKKLFEKAQEELLKAQEKTKDAEDALDLKRLENIKAHNLEESAEAEKSSQQRKALSEKRIAEQKREEENQQRILQGMYEREADYLKQKAALEEQYRKQAEAEEAATKKETEDAAKQLQQEEIRRLTLDGADIHTIFQAKRDALKEQYEQDQAAHADNLDALKSLDLKYYNDIKQLTIEEGQSKIQLKQQIQTAELSIANSTVSGLMALNDILIQQGQEHANIQKGLALFQIGIDTAVAISGLNQESAKASAQMAGILGPATPIFTAAYYTQGIVRILSNVAKAKQILQGSSGGSGGGVPSIGGSSGGAIRPPQLSQVGSTSTNLDNLNNSNGRQYQPVVKAVVTETDITSSQKRVSRIVDKTKH